MNPTNNSIPRTVTCAAIALGLLGLLYGHWVAASDVVEYSITKGQFLEQVSANSASPIGSSGFVFQAEVTASTTDSVSSAGVTLPNTTNRTLTSNGTNRFLFTDFRNSRNTLDAAYSNATYTFEIVTLNDGTNMPALTFTTNTYPNSPRLTNWVTAQLINASSNFSLSWNSFNNATSNDFISLTLFDSSSNQVFASGAFGSSNALNGTDTGITIPADTLLITQRYRGELTFFRVLQLDTNSIPDATGLAGLFAQTGFAISTQTNYTGLAVLTTTLSNAEIGVFYTATLSITGGLPPYTVISEKGLPPALQGLTVNASGISGIPSRPWNAKNGTPKSKRTKFTLLIADQTGASIEQPLALRTFEPVGVDTPRLRDGAVSNSYSSQLKVVRGLGPYVWANTSSNLPAGLGFDTTNGVISGTPTVTGLYQNITIRVTDSLGGTHSRNYSLTIRE